MAKNWKSFVAKEDKSKSVSSGFDEIPIDHGDLRSLAEGNENIKELLDERSDLESRMNGLIGSSTEKVDPRFVPAAITSISERKKQFADWQKKRAAIAKKAKESKAANAIHKKKQPNKKEPFNTKEKKDFRNKKTEKREFRPTKKEPSLTARNRPKPSALDKEKFDKVDRFKRLKEEHPFEKGKQGRKEKGVNEKRPFEKKQKEDDFATARVSNQPSFEWEERKKKPASQEAIDTRKQDKKPVEDTLDAFRNKLEKPKLLQTAENKWDQVENRREKLKKNKLVQLVSSKEKGATQKQLSNGIEKIEVLEQQNGSTLGGISSFKNKLEGAKKTVGKIEDKWDSMKERVTKLTSVKETFSDRRKNIIADKEDANKIFDRRDFLNKIRISQLKEDARKAQAIAKLIQEKKQKKKEEEKPPKATEEKQDKGLSTDSKDESKNDPKEKGKKQEETLSNQINSDDLDTKSKKKEARREGKRTRKKKNKGLEV